MKMFHCMILTLVVCCGLALPIASQTNPDAGSRDAFLLNLTHAPEERIGNTTFLLTLYLCNDSSVIRSAAVGFEWENNSVVLDSASISKEAESAFSFGTYLYRKSSLDSSNKYRQFLFAGVSFADGGLLPSQEPIPLANYYFSSKIWAETDQVTVDTATFNAGSTMVLVGNKANGDRVRYVPYWPGRLTVYDANRPCCLSYRGNVDGDPSGVVDISDFTYLLAHLFTVAAPTYPCPEAANVDGSPDGKVDLNDLQTLLDFLYGSMTFPPPCPK